MSTYHFCCVNSETSKCLWRVRVKGVCSKGYLVWFRWAGTQGWQSRLGGLPTSRQTHHDDRCSHLLCFPWGRCWRLSAPSPWLHSTIMDCSEARSLLICTYVDSYRNVRITEACVTLTCSSIGSNTELHFFLIIIISGHLGGWKKLEIVCSMGTLIIPHPQWLLYPMNFIIVLEFAQVSDVFQWFMPRFPSRQRWGLGKHLP